MKMALSFVDVPLNMNALQWDFFHTLEDKTHFMSFCVTNSSLIFKWSFINRLQGKYNMWLIGKKRFENNHIWRHTTLVKISMKVQLNFNFSMTEEVKDSTNWLDVINEWSYSSDSSKMWKYSEEIQYGNQTGVLKCSFKNKTDTDRFQDCWKIWSITPY